MMVLDEFSSQAISVLRPPLEEIGYSLLAVGPRLVEFASRDLSIRLFQGRKSDVIGLEITRSGELLNLTHLLKAAELDDPGMAVRGRYAIRSRLLWLRSFLFPRFDKLLRGDTLNFLEVAQVARQVDKEYNFKLLVAPEIERANEAFHERRYERVVEILEPLREQLSLVSLRRLAFAKRELAKRV
jgi:hypothetical protein